jgi:hypothetical protein
MKLRLLGGAAVLLLAAWQPAARATMFDFTYSGALVNFTIPTSDTYQILAFGAQGGTVTFSVQSAPAVAALRSAVTSA